VQDRVGRQGKGREKGGVGRREEKEGRK